jgi:outer membrane protein insertion porin family
VRRYFSYLKFGIIILGLGLLSLSTKIAFGQDIIELAQTKETIKNIVVSGAQRIEPDTIKSYLLVQPGDTFDTGKFDRSLKSLFNTGLFADVTLRRKGDDLIVTVIENPVINLIAFEGNSDTETDTLKSEITLRPRVIYTRTKVLKDVKRILAIYRSSGRFAATVEPKVIQLEQNRVNLIFEIKEGDLTKIQSIRFLGNREYGDGELRSVIQTKESTWYRFLSSDDKYDPDRLTFDRELLRRFYLSDGFADFAILSAVAELTPDRKDFFLTYTLDEGRRYRFGKINVEARLRDLNVNNVTDEVRIEKDDWYSLNAINKTVAKLTDKVGQLGYSFVDIRPRINRDRKKRTIDVTFEINEGPRVFVERINIVGNVRTKDKVIRREIRLIEGDAFNSSKLRRSRQRIQNLGFFQSINVERVKGSAPDKSIIKVDVEEKSTGQLSFGAGFSSSSGIMGDFGITEKNFLGKGQELGLKLRVASLASEIDLSFTEPYFLDREIRAGFDVFHITKDLQDISSYDTKNTGFGLRAGYKVTEYLRQDWGYNLNFERIDNIASTASASIKSASDDQITSQVSHTVTYDKRDGSIKPTEGHIIRLNTQLAGLGGSTKHLRNNLKMAKYYPISDKWVASITGKLGHIVGLGEDVHVLKRFNVGPDTIRGFAPRGIGPRDSRTKDALGGEWFYGGSLQLNFPLGLPDSLPIGGRAFTDVASIGKIEPTQSYIFDEASLRAGAGIGITYQSPFGPLGIDAAVPILKEDYDITENIHFNFGTRF